MAAHRRPRTAGIPGLVRLSAVSLSVATAAVATACGVGGSRSDDAQSVSVASVPDAPTEQSPTDPGPTTASAGTPSPASASPTSRPAASSPAGKSAAARTAAPRPARSARPAESAKPAATKGGSGSGSSGFSSGYPTGADARGAVKAAVAAARADGKKVLIDFGANWCGNCKAADKVFATRDVGALLDASYHVVKVDIGSQDSGAFDLLRDYCSGQGAYKMPVLVVLDGNGNVVTETHSTGNPDLTTAGLSAFLRKWA
ncbi:thioredoxin family protein [Streptomyces sp. NPDC059442]|uniref:thioredoxin family protein n=1 Tax=Streptomyces sp. NPDC059442 TaxID=3346830 RepID=UPI00368C77B4